MHQQCWVYDASLADSGFGVISCKCGTISINLIVMMMGHGKLKMLYRSKSSQREGEPEYNNSAPWWGRMAKYGRLNRNNHPNARKKVLHKQGTKLDPSAKGSRNDKTELPRYWQVYDPTRFLRRLRGRIWDCLDAWLRLHLIFTTHHVMNCKVDNRIPTAALVRPMSMSESRHVRKATRMQPTLNVRSVGQLMSWKFNSCRKMPSLKFTLK